jgi:hypothetical protein
MTTCGVRTVCIEKRPDMSGTEGTEVEHPFGQVPDRLFAHRPSPTIVKSDFYFRCHM